MGNTITNMDNYISWEEAAEYLGIKAPTLRSWLRNPNNEIPAHKVRKTMEIQKVRD